MNRDRDKRIEDFKSRLRWAQEQLGEGSLIFHSIPEESGSFVSYGADGSTSKSELALAAILYLVRVCARDYAEANGHDRDEFWWRLLTRAIRIEEDLLDAEVEP